MARYSNNSFPSASAVVPDREMLLVLERLLWEEEDAEDLGRDLAA